MIAPEESHAGKTSDQKATKGNLQARNNSV